MRLITTLDDIDAGLAALVRGDRKLAAIARQAGRIPLRRHPADFHGMAGVVIGQQISIHAAAAINGRLAALLDAPLTAKAFLAASEEALRAAGLSAAKIRTLRALAEATVSGELDLMAIAGLPGDEAVARLIRLPGIGPWTAEVFLMFCAGHPDIWPGGDLALQNAIQDAYGLDRRPSDRETRLLAAAWSPWRSVAARLFWTYYGVKRLGRPMEPV